MPTLRATAILTIFFGMTLLLMPFQWFLVRLRIPLRKSFPMHYHRAVCRLLGIETVRRGNICSATPVLLVCNHTSWLDIPVLSSIAPLSFIAKREVGGWPFFGSLARLQRTVFVERRASRTAVQRDVIRERLAQKDRLILFPEGTSNDGNRVLPFKSGFFAVAENHIDGRPLTVQPLSIAYTRLDGIPMGRRLRPYFAWYGDMELAPHLWQAVKWGRLRVDIVFHAPVQIDQFADRKAMAAACQRLIADGVANTLAGRPEMVDDGARRSMVADTTAPAGEPAPLSEP